MAPPPAIMTTDIALVLGITAAALVLFVTGRFRIDQVALAVPAVLLLAGLVTPEQAVAGFGHPGTITIAAMLALSLGLVQTGAIGMLSRWIQTAPLGGPRRRLALLLLLVGVVSAFLNNTAVVVVFLPVFMALARQAGEPNSRYLIPLSYSAILGGTVTLMGTSTNLVVWGMARSRGLDDLGLFSIAPLGLIYLVVGQLYLMIAGRWLLPRRAGETDLSSKYGLRRFVTELDVTGDSPVAGSTLAELGWEKSHEVTILGVHRGDQAVRARGDLRLRAGDAIYVQGHTDSLLALAAKEGLESPIERHQGGPGTDPGAAQPRMVELLVSRDAPLAGRTLSDYRFQDRHGCIVLALQHHGVTVRERLGAVRLEPGDLLLVHGPAPALDALADQHGFIPLGEVQSLAGARPHALFAVAIMAAVVGVAGAGLLPILPAALTGVVAMVFSGCLKIQEIYDEMDWMVIFMLAGMIPLGTAMDETGAAVWLAGGIADAMRGVGPVLAIGAFYLCTSLLTEILSNNVTAIVMTPIAIGTAADLQMNPYALLVAVMFGASACFVTPIGYQTNAMVYGPGGYRFIDYVRVGLPLNLILLVVATLMIPRFWP